MSQYNQNIVTVNNQIKIPIGPSAKKYISKVVKRFNQLDKSTLKIYAEYDYLIGHKKEMYLTVNLRDSNEKIIIWYDCPKCMTYNTKKVIYDNKIEIYETENDLYNIIKRCIQYIEDNSNKMDVDSYNDYYIDGPL